MGVVIVGAGEMGYHLARRLSSEKRSVTLIDRSADQVAMIDENLDVRAVVGRGASPAMLRKAGIEQANILIAVTDSDEVNLMACFMAGHLNESVTKVARLREDDFSEMPEILDKDHLNIDLVISPEIEAVNRLIEVLQIPAATDVINFAEGRIKLFGIQLLADSPFVGRSLIDLRNEFPAKRILIPVIFRESGAIIPTGKDIIRSRDTIYVIAGQDSIPKLIEAAGLQSQPLNSFMISGGTVAGVKIAKELERRKVGSIKLAESDPARCEEIASELDYTMVLKTGSVDQEFLSAEGIEETDGFLAMTDHDENNALTALLAKRMGAKRVAVRTSTIGYHRLLTAVGVDIVVNPRLAGASKILHYLRKGKVISVSMFPGEEVEAIEFEAVETSALVGKPLSQVRFPQGAILGAVERAREFFIPHGDTVIEPGDRVIVFSRREAIPSVEKLLTVSLGFF